MNHPAAQDRLELQPQEPATRAEAAYSVARALAVDDRGVAGVQDALATFTLPTPTPWQNRVRRTAIALIG